MTDVSKTHITRAIKITLAKRRQLERVCGNRMNWTDGGHWMGSGVEPDNCFKQEHLHSSSSHTYHFPTDEAATKWNIEQEKSIRYLGHLGTVALTTAAAVATKGWYAVAVGTLAAIVKDETQASIPCPRMARGWSYEVIFEHDFQWSPLRFTRQHGLVQTVTRISRDFDGNIVHHTSYTRKYQLDELPESLGRLLAGAESKKTSSEYK